MKNNDANQGNLFETRDTVGPADAQNQLTPAAARERELQKGLMDIRRTKEAARPEKAPTKAQVEGGYRQDPEAVANDKANKEADRQALMTDARARLKAAQERANQPKPPLRPPNPNPEGLPPRHP